ncbi:hypothetical protein EI94DRAFT_1705200 [Lactarius quietus]|nr:hypothetical protein EI94DRAFT_1705200 [Lactarius quietus]
MPATMSADLGLQVLVLSAQYSVLISTNSDRILMDGTLAADLDVINSSAECGGYSAQIARSCIMMFLGSNVVRTHGARMSTIPSIRVLASRSPPRNMSRAVPLAASRATNTASTFHFPPTRTGMPTFQTRKTTIHGSVREAENFRRRSGEDAETIFLGLLAGPAFPDPACDNAVHREWDTIWATG